MTPRRPREVPQRRAEEAEALALSIAREVEQAEEARILRAVRRRRFIRFWRVLAVLASAGLWLLPPAASARHEPAMLESDDPALALQVALYLQSELVEAYRERNGRLPRELVHAGEVLPGVRYVRTSSDGFTLSGFSQEAGEVEMVFPRGAAGQAALRSRVAAMVGVPEGGPPGGGGT